MIRSHATQARRALATVLAVATLFCSALFGAASAHAAPQCNQAPLPPACSQPPKPTPAPLPRLQSDVMNVAAGATNGFWVYSSVIPPIASGRPDGWQTPWKVTLTCSNGFSQTFDFYTGHDSYGDPFVQAYSTGAGGAAGACRVITWDQAAMGVRAAVVHAPLPGSPYGSWQIALIA